MNSKRTRTYKASTVATAAVLAVWAFCGCSSDDEGFEEGTRIPLKLASVVEGQQMQTRFSGEGSGTQGKELLAGQTVWVWANYSENKVGKHNASDSYLPAWKLTAGSSGQLSGVTSTTLAGALRYYPVENDKITLYSVQGNFSETIAEQTTALPTTLTHSVIANQTNSASYASSDLLWGIKENQQYEIDETTKEIKAETIIIPFRHLLSKIEITLALADGESVYDISDLRAAKVELIHVLPQVEVTMSNGSIAAASGDETTILAKAEGQAAGYQGDWLEAIVPPQKFAAAKALICVTMKVNGADRPLYYVPSEALEVVANHRYRFSFKVSSQAITLGSVTYEDWGAATKITPIPVE